MPSFPDGIMEHLANDPRNFDEDFDDTNTEDDDILVSTIPSAVLGKPEPEPFPMLKKTNKKPKATRNATVAVVDRRPTLVHCGNHLIDPNDVVCITKTRRHSDLYVVKLRSNPNPEYPIWVSEADITTLIQQFRVVTENG